jgi:hypothetical protein
MVEFHIGRLEDEVATWWACHGRPSKPGRLVDSRLARTAVLALAVLITAIGCTSYSAVHPTKSQIAAMNAEVWTEFVIAAILVIVVGGAYLVPRWSYSAKSKTWQELIDTRRLVPVFTPLVRGVNRACTDADLSLSFYYPRSCYPEKDLIAQHFGVCAWLASAPEELLESGLLVELMTAFAGVMVAVERTVWATYGDDVERRGRERQILMWREFQSRVAFSAVS